MQEIKRSDIDPKTAIATFDFYEQQEINKPKFNPSKTKYNVNDILVDGTIVKYQELTPDQLARLRDPKDRSVNQAPLTVRKKVKSGYGKIGMTQIITQEFYPFEEEIDFKDLLELVPDDHIFYVQDHLIERVKKKRPK